MSTQDYKLEYSCYDIKDHSIKEYNIHWYGNNLGIICMKVVDRTLEIYNIFIDEEHQANGHGINICNKLSENVDNIVAIDVVPQAVGFWERVGAEIVPHPHFNVAKELSYES